MKALFIYRKVYFIDTPKIDTEAALLNQFLSRR